MALSIEDPETERLARSLAQLTGEDITTATERAIEERLRRVGGQTRKATLLEDMAEIRRRWNESQSRMSGRQKRFLDMTSTPCFADGDRYIGDRGNRSQRA